MIPSPAYLRGLLHAVPAPELLRAALRRLGGRAQARTPAPREVLGQGGAEALAAAPRLFTCADLRPCLTGPGAVERGLAVELEAIRARAERTLAHQVEIFGRPCVLGRHIDWLRDPLTGHRFEGLESGPEALRELLGGPDPKPLWELGRGAHLVELAVAARLGLVHGPQARVEFEAEVRGLIEATRHSGVHHASPLEIALRGIAWLAALELLGGARAFARPFVETLALALAYDAHALAAGLEDRGVVPGNHLLGDLVGLLVVSGWLDGAPGMRPLRLEAEARLCAEAQRQVEADGAHFEGSTGYHRFALELLLVAHLAARGLGRALGIDRSLGRMFRYARRVITPEGTHPGFGDDDEARALPLVARGPREAGYLLSVGLGLLGDPALRAPGVAASIEALLIAGPQALAAWRDTPPAAPTPLAPAGRGGVHVLRGGGLYAALRAGPYGQRGVGGHAHNDQLAVVVYAEGRGLVTDPGTACYLADPLVRDRFRGTAAHATIVVEGTEQSPFVDRPFALPDRAAGRLVRAEREGARLRLVGEHSGYVRLPGRIVHRRELLLDEEARALLVEDRLVGRGRISAELRIPLACVPLSGGPPWPGPESLLGHQVRSGVALPGGDWLVFLSGDGTDHPSVGPRGRPSFEAPPRVISAWRSPRFGSWEPAALVSLPLSLNLPATVRHAFVAGPARE